jgi:hypothetical protein
MTTTTNRVGGERDSRREVATPLPEQTRSFTANRSTMLILMNEALSRARLLVANPARTRIGATRPARVIAASAAKQRERLAR